MGMGAYGRGRGFGPGRFAYGGFAEPAYGPSSGTTEAPSAAEERGALQQQLGAIEEHLAELRRQLQATID